MKNKTMDKCPDCYVPVGFLHAEGCDVERCLKCGGQRLSCGCRQTKRDRRQRWEGEWPGLDACRKFNLWSKMVPSSDRPHGFRWAPCDKDDPEAGEDLNTLAVVCRWDSKKQEWVKR